jgi:hypothetical protein
MGSKSNRPPVTVPSSVVAAPSASGSKKVFLVSFLMANLVLASFYIDIWCTPNAVSRALPVVTLLKHGTFRIDSLASVASDKSKVGEHYYSDKAPFPTLACVPIYWGMAKLGLARVTPTTGIKYPIYAWESVGVKDGRYTMSQGLVPILFMGSLVFGSIPFAVLVFLAMKKVLDSSNGISPVVLVMLSFYGSYLYVFSGTFFGHMIAALLLVLGYILIKERRYLWSGLCVGLAFGSEYTVALAIPLWGLVIWLREKRLRPVAMYGLGTLPSVAAMAVYNYLITGNPLKMLNAYHAVPAFGKELSHHYGFHLPTFASLWGLSFSIYMGLIPHVPMLLFCAWFLFKEWRPVVRDLPRNYLAMFAIPFFLLISSFFTWWGGWSYGPRYLLCLAALLVYEGICYLSNKRLNVWLFALLTSVGVIAGLLAKATLVYMIPDHSSMEEAAPGGPVFGGYILPAFRAGHLNANNLLSLGGSSPPEDGPWLWLLLFVAVTFTFSWWHKKLYSLPAPAPAARKTPKPKRKTG